MPQKSVFGLALALLLGAAPCVYAGESLLVVAADGPGSAEQARTVMDNLGRILGAHAPPLAPLRADYCPDLASARAAIALNRPAFALLSLEAFLELRRELAVDPLARALPREGAKAGYCVVAKLGGPTDLATLRGRRLATTGIVSPAFLGAIALGTEESPDAMFTLVAARGGPLRALKMVSRGDVDGAVIEVLAWTALAAAPAESPLAALAKGLAVVHEGPQLPDAVVVRLGDRGEGAMLESGRLADARLVAALVGLAESPEGKPLLEDLTLRGFASASAADYRDLVLRDEAWRERHAPDPPGK